MWQSLPALQVLRLPGLFLFAAAALCPLVYPIECISSQLGVRLANPGYISGCHKWELPANFLWVVTRVFLNFSQCIRWILDKTPVVGGWVTAAWCIGNVRAVVYISSSWAVNHDTGCYSLFTHLWVEKCWMLARFGRLWTMLTFL